MVKITEEIEEKALTVGLSIDDLLKLCQDNQGYIPWQLGKLYNMNDEQLKLIFEDYKDFIPWQYGKEFDMDEIRELFKTLDL